LHFFFGHRSSGVDRNIAKVFRCVNAGIPTTIKAKADATKSRTLFLSRRVKQGKQTPKKESDRESKPKRLSRFDRQKA
jgi:hypothetical protein